VLHNKIAINVTNSINRTDGVLQGDPLNSLLLKVVTAGIQTVMNSKGSGMFYMYANGFFSGNKDMKCVQWVEANGLIYKRRHLIGFQKMRKNLGRLTSKMQE
jgi:hypothetical protein